MWLGESLHSLDAKNRVVIPRRLQAGLSRDRDADGRTTAILTRGFEGCLFVFAEDTFGRLIERMKTQAFEGPRERKMQRLFFSSSQHCVLDGTGRLLIPEKLKTLVGIEKEVVLVGLIDRLEIWPRAAWQAFERDSEGDFDQLDGVLFGGGDGEVEAEP